MSSDSRASREVKGEENISSQVSNAGKTSATSCPSAPDSSTLRRSERLDKQAAINTPPPPPPHVARRTGRGDNQKKPTSPLRRSERGKKSLSQLTLEANEVGKSEKQDKQPVRMSKRIMNARAHKEMLDPQNSKTDVRGQSVELNKSSEVSVECSSNNEDVGNDKTLRGPNPSANKSAKESGDFRQESSGTDQKSIIGIENDLAEAADSVKGSKCNDYVPEENAQTDITGSTLSEKILLESDQDTTSSKRKRNSTDVDSDVSTVVSSIDKWILVGGVCPSDGNIISKSAETCSKCFKRQRISCDSEQHDICCCSPRLDHGSHVSSLKKENLHQKLKPEVANLCEILKLPEHVKRVAESFLEYVMNNHHVSRESETILQALQISVCWTAASLLKHKLDHNESLALAKQHLKFGCRKEEAEYVYSMLRCLRRVFLQSNSLKAASTSRGFSADHLQSLRSNLDSVSAMVEDLTPDQGCSDDLVLSQLGLQQDVVNNIADVKKKFHRKKEKLSQKQLEEIQNLNKHYEAKRNLLEKNKRTGADIILTLFGNGSTAQAKRTELDVQYDKRFAELNCQMEMDRKNLEEGHLAALNKMQEKEGHWVDRLKSWAQVEVINKPASGGAILNHCNLKLSDVCTKDQTANKAKSVSNGECPDETHVIPSSSDDDGNMLPNLKQSLASGPHNAFDVNVSSSKEQNFDEPVTLKVAKVGSSNGGQSLGEPILVEHDVGSTECMENQPHTNRSLFSEAVAGRSDKEVSILMPSCSNELEQDMPNALRSTSATGESAEDDSNDGERNVDCTVASHITTQAASLGHECASPTTVPRLQDAAMQSANWNATRPAETANSHSQDASNYVNSLEGQGVDNQVELSLPDGPLQSSPQPLEISVTGSRMHVPDAVPMTVPPPVMYSLFQATPPVPMPQQVSQDPLQNELDRITKETSQTLATLEEAKLRLKSDCEKEIEKVLAEIREKYGAKLLQVESEFLLKKKEQDENRRIVYMNKILADLFRSKCTDDTFAASAGTQQEVSSSFMQHMMQVSAQNLVQRPPVVGRPPQVSSMYPTSNLQFGGGYRPSSPQLSQLSRPPAQSTGPGISYSACPMPGQVASNNPCTTPFLSQLLSASPPVSLSNSQSGIRQPEAAGLFPSIASSLSAVALLMDIDSRANRNTILPRVSQLIDTASASNPSALLQNVAQENSASPIYLSDDE